MGKYDFESIEDLREAIKVVSNFVDDAISGQLFELNSHGDSNLCHGDFDRIFELAQVVEPDLRESFPRLFHSSADFDDGVVEACRHLRRAFTTLGILLGARMADPSGKSFAQLSDAWIRATLARPRYRHLSDMPAKRRKAAQ